METWKLLIVTILSATVLGCVSGVFLGKRQIRKMSGRHKPLLTAKERIIYSTCFLLGVGFILFGVFYEFPSAQNPNPQIIDGEVLPGGMEPGIEYTPEAAPFDGETVVEDDAATTEEATEGGGGDAPAARPSPRISDGVDLPAGNARVVVIG